MIIFTLLIIVAWPGIAWLDWKITALSTDFWTTRFVLIFAYILVENFPFGAIDNFVLLVADGIMLSQIVSIYLFNMVSMKCILFLLPPLFMMFSLKQLFDVMLYENEKGKKSNFVRLIGIHDTLYLLLMFALVITILSMIDAFSQDWLHLVNCLYLPLFAIYTANRVMDDKMEKIAKNNCFSLQALISTVFFIGLYLFV
jgi:hypothetical protein